MVNENISNETSYRTLTLLSDLSSGGGGLEACMPARDKPPISLTKSYVTTMAKSVKSIV